MIIREKYTASIVGAGKLAYSLVPALENKGIMVKSIVSRDVGKAAEYAEMCNADAIRMQNRLQLDANLIFLTVSDDHITEIAGNLIVADDQILVHTSGSVPINILEGFASHYGVFYPLQTFSGKRMIDFTRVPLCLEAGNVETLNILQDVAGMLSSKVMILSGKQRKQLHLAAVFVSNFTNHMYDIGAYLMEKEKLDFSLLYPLIEETTQKIRRMKPGIAQTGPAVRNNQIIMDDHKKMLQSERELSELYEAISKSIKDFN